MKALRKIVNWTASAVLLTGISYSCVALSAKPVYASTCNCTEEQQDADLYCEAHFGTIGLKLFSCPVNSNEYAFICASDPRETVHLVPCD